MFLFCLIVFDQLILDVYQYQTNRRQETLMIRGSLVTSSSGTFGAISTDKGSYMLEKFWWLKNYNITQKAQKLRPGVVICASVFDKRLSFYEFFDVHKLIYHFRKGQCDEKSSQKWFGQSYSGTYYIARDA